MGPPAHVPGMRARGLLRFLQKQARHQTLSCHAASFDAFHRAGRKVDVVLRGRNDDRRSSRLSFAHAAGTYLPVADFCALIKASTLLLSIRVAPVSTNAGKGENGS